MALQGKIAFLVTQPLQLMIAVLVLRQLRLDEAPAFCITNSFSGASDVAGRLPQLMPSQIDVRYFETQAEAYSHLGANEYRHAFIDSDVGLSKAITLLRLKRLAPTLSLNVYEEGLGTYRNDLYLGLKRRVFPAFGIATRFGASPFVSRVFVLEPDEFRQNFPDLASKVVGITESMDAFLVHDRDLLNAVFGSPGLPVPHGAPQSRCALYLTNWELDSNVIKKFKGLGGDLYVKAHPHIKSTIKDDDLLSIATGLPAELAIADLLERHTSVQVYHHGSSASRYMKSPRVSYHHVDALG